MVHSLAALLLLSSALRLGLGDLRGSEELTAHCYHFPGKDYGKSNNVKLEYGSSPYLLLGKGDAAIDFSLPLAADTGTTVTLSSLLQDRPVVLLWGQYTCPAFQGLNSDSMFIGSSYEEENALIDEYSEQLHVVHIVGPEPHPLWPYANFDSGSIKMNHWSTIKQPTTFEERMTLSVPPVQALVDSRATVLVEYLDGKEGAYNNHVWCSYANAARAAVLISMDGTVAEAQSWFNKDELVEAIEEQLGRKRKKP